MSNQNGEIATYSDRFRLVRGELTKDSAMAELDKALAGRIPRDFFARCALTAYKGGGDRMMAADPRSFLSCVIQVAQLGLSPDPLLGEVHFVPRGGHVTIMMGYQGLLTLVRRSGQIAAIDAGVVHERDEIEVERGLQQRLRHVPSLSDDPGEVRAAYAIAHLSTGLPVFWLSPRWEIERARAAAGNKSPAWASDYGAMAQKTALRRLCKLLPRHPDAAAAIALEERGEMGIPIDPDITRVSAAPEQPATLDDLAAAGHSIEELPAGEPDAGQEVAS